MAKITVNGTDVETILRESQELKRENSRLSKLNAKLREQLQNQGRLLDREMCNGRCAREHFPDEQRKESWIVTGWEEAGGRLAYFEHEYDTQPEAVEEYISLRRLPDNFVDLRLYLSDGKQIRRKNPMRYLSIWDVLG